MKDQFNRNIDYIRISVTDRCNLRCRYCMPSCGVASVPHGKILTFDEIVRLTQRFAEVGIRKVKITGGEPLLHKDMTEFLGKIKALGYKIKLDSNGSFPELLEEIVKANLVDRVAMDIKNSPQLYGKTVGLESFDIKNVERSKNFLLEGRVEYEFRTTAVKGLHTADSIRNAAKWIEGAKEYYLQQFKDSGDVLNLGGLSAFNEDEMKELKLAAAEFVPHVQLRGI